MAFLFDGKARLCGPGIRKCNQLAMPVFRETRNKTLGKRTLTVYARSPLVSLGKLRESAMSDCRGIREAVAFGPYTDRVSKVPLV